MNFKSRLLTHSDQYAGPYVESYSSVITGWISPKVVTETATLTRNFADSGWYLWQE
jgi:hypothetical protein